jgi:predicted permease
VRAFFRRIGATFSRKRADTELAAELKSHLEMLTDEHIRAGVPPDAARREARLRLGGIECVKENCRDARGIGWLEDLWQDLRYTLRTLRDRPGFAAVVLVILALGTGATTVMFTLINTVLLKPLPYPDPDRLLAIHCLTDRFGDTFGLTSFDYRDFKQETKTLVGIAAWDYGGGPVTQPGVAEYAESRGVTWDFFSVLGVRLKLGRAFLPDEDRPGGSTVAIISERLWDRRFARDPQAIGKTIIFAGRPYIVVGVAPSDLVIGPSTPDVFTPFWQEQTPRIQNRNAYMAQVLARLRNGYTVQQAESELALIGAQLKKQYPATNAGRSYQAHLLRKDMVGDIRSTLLLLLGAVSAVLLIACVNVAGLMLARAVSRDRELAMRLALGAKGSRLVRQCMTESAVLGLAGGALGMLGAVAGLRPFVLLWPAGLPRAQEVRVDWTVLLFVAAVSILSGFLFGLAPAWRAPSRELEQALRAGSRSVTGNGWRLHTGFVVTQIALAVVLLVSAGILGKTLLRLSALDPGFKAANVITARAAISPGALSNPEEARARWSDFVDRARSLPGVQAVSLADIIPMRTGTNVLTYWNSPAVPPTNEQTSALADCVTNDYLRVMRIPLLRGRFFDERDRLNSQPVVVIDEVMAEHAFKGENPVGKSLWIQALNRSPVLVIGLVKHVRNWGPSDSTSQLRDQFYYPFSQVQTPLIPFFSSVMSVAVRTSGEPLSILEPLRKAVRGAGGDQVLYDVNTMEQVTSASLARQRFLMVLFGVFAGLALILACVGLYGVLAYITSQRVPEIGVRMAIGASGRDVVRMVMRQSVGMILAGVAIGLGGAVGVARMMPRLVVGAQGLDALTISLMTSLLLLAALGASFVPARRASRVDPMKALRQE